MRNSAKPNSRGKSLGSSQETPSSHSPGSVHSLISPWKTHVSSLIFLAVGLFLGLCLLTYHPSDLGFLSSEPHRPTENWGGILGAWIGCVGREGFGWASLVVPLVCALLAFQSWRGHRWNIQGLSLSIAVGSLVVCSAVLLAMQGTTVAEQTDLGGLGGWLLESSGQEYLGTVGTLLMTFCVAALSLIIVFGQAGLLRWPNTATQESIEESVLLDRPEHLDPKSSPMAARFAGREKDAPAAQVGWVQKVVGGRLAGIMRGSARTNGQKLSKDAATPSGGSLARESANLKQARGAEALDVSDFSPAQGSGGVNPSAGRAHASPTPKPKVSETAPRIPMAQGYSFPPLSLLMDPPPLSQRQVIDDLQVNARILEETLREFGIQASVVNVDRGPTITRYELTPAPGVKLTKIVSLADDLALVLKAASCHIVAPIPGKGRVGIDVPNSISTTVYLKEILSSPSFRSSNSPLILPIGKDVSGEPIVTELRDCPHLLIAGATGSGKTVCLNSLLLGILMHTTPEQVNFLMIDPKMVELVMFNGLPHLVAPVVTSPKKASVALHWAVQEMERRYQLLAHAGVRNISLYNTWVTSQPIKAAATEAQGEAADDSPKHEGPLAYLVIVIDELADLMMVASQDVEGAITRLAQLSRAVGIHMILATQRPSVDVITGVIKANFPARIAFQVASKVDSRTILDSNGADKLVGRGDLLFLRPGTAKPIRAQATFVTDKEIEQVTHFVKQQRKPSYDPRLMDSQHHSDDVAAGGITEKDELYEIAKQLVLDTGQASTSLLQRRLRLGYGRAARILDLMEQEGLVGPPQGSRPREVLVNRESTRIETES